MQVPDFAPLLESIEDSRRDAASSFLSSKLSPCLSADIGKPSNQNPSDTGSRIGGPVLLPPGVEHPCDRSGRPMTFVAQINFSDMGKHNLHIPDKGILLLFWNAGRDYSNPKDRHAFKCVWVREPESRLFVPSNSPEATLSNSENLKFELTWSLPQFESAWLDEPIGTEERRNFIDKITCKPQVQICGESGRQFDLLQEIAAFSGNGISWSEARRKDSCFSHLIDTASDWRLLLKIDSLPECGLDLGNLSMYWLIRDEDFNARNYDKAWLLLK